MSMTLADATYEMGVTRLFGSCDLGTWGLHSGWAVPEEAHVWNDGLDATFSFHVRKPRRSCQIIFEGEPFLVGEIGHQDVILYVNGARVGFWRLTEPGPCSLSVVIEPEHFFDRKGSALVKCVWHLPNSARPSELGLNADTRQLGFCFRSFLLEEIV